MGTVVGTGPGGTITVADVEAAAASPPAAGGGAPTEVPTMTVSATFDHRIIDGGASGRFLAQLKEAIEATAVSAT